jgi:transcriptional regulator
MPGVIHKWIRHKRFMKRGPSRDLIQGTLDMLVLRTLGRGPLHGYAIAVAIEHRSADELRVEEGALYPALHRLELGGLLKSEWKLSETNRRAKFYQLTAAGRKHLAAEAANWSRLAAAVARVMEAE